jgi:hypothetical protein
MAEYCLASVLCLLHNLSAKSFPQPFYGKARECTSARSGLKRTDALTFAYTQASHAQATAPSSRHPNRRSHDGLGS